MQIVDRLGSLLHCILLLVGCPRVSLRGPCCGFQAFFVDKWVQLPCVCAYLFYCVYYLDAGFAREIVLQCIAVAGLGSVNAWFWAAVYRHSKTPTVCFFRVREKRIPGNSMYHVLIACWLLERYTLTSGSAMGGLIVYIWKVASEASRRAAPAARQMPPTHPRPRWRRHLALYPRKITCCAFAVVVSSSLLLRGGVGDSRIGNIGFDDP